VCAVIAVLVGTWFFSVSSAVAATPIFDYSNLLRFQSPNPQAFGGWAKRLRTVPDLDHDGVNEILVSDYNESFGGFPGAGRVYMQDGDTRQIMYSLDSPQIQAGANFGQWPAVIGDVNGDGSPDFLVTADGQSTLADGTPCTPPATGPLGGCNQQQGKAWVFEGRTGQMLYELNNPHPQGFARFGFGAGRAGDINGDGVPDIIVTGFSNDVPTGCGLGADGRRLPAVSVPAGCHSGEGEAFIFSGKPSDHANGQSGLLRTLNLPPSDETPPPCGGTGRGVVSCGGFGGGAQGIGDINGDGVIDQQVAARTFNYDTITHGPCADPAAPSCNKSQGAVYLFSGKDGSLIRRTDDPVPQAGALFGPGDIPPLSPGDVNGDGVPDYYSTGFLQDGSTGLFEAGRAWVFSGRTGQVLYELKDPTPHVGGFFGFSMATTDYNRDGTPDLYVGKEPHHATMGADDQSGGTYVFDGKDGSLLKSLVLPASDAQLGGAANVGSNLGWTVIAPGDLNGDGQPDFVAGAPFQDADPSGVLPFNCQAPTPGCLQDVGTEFFFMSNNQVNPVMTGAPSGITVMTGAASGITAKGAVLHGAIDTRGRATTWRFQYGTTRGYGRSTAVRSIGPDLGTVPVAQRIGGLRPFTTYHFRVVGTTSSTGMVSYGPDRSFRTGATGTLALAPDALTVSHGRLSIPLTCASTLACRGRVTVNTRTRIVHSRATGLVLCATRTFAIGAHRRATVSVRVRPACLSLLARAPRRRSAGARAPRRSVAGLLSSYPRSGQRAVVRSVTLALR